MSSEPRNLGRAYLASTGHLGESHFRGVTEKRELFQASWFHPAVSPRPQERTRSAESFGNLHSRFWGDESASAQSRLGSSTGPTAHTCASPCGAIAANEEGTPESGPQSPFGDESPRHRTRTGPTRRLQVLFESAQPGCARFFHCRFQL
jgi:hypothetical protein